MNTLRRNRKLVGILAVLTGQVIIIATAVFAGQWFDFVALVIADWFGTDPIGMAWANVVVQCATLALFATPSLLFCVLTAMFLLKTADAETRCRACGYILRGLSEPRCSECGERI